MRTLILTFICAALLPTSAARAQLFGPNATGVSMGHLHYFVRDMDTAVDFYCQQLGFLLELRPTPVFAMLYRGDLRLLLSVPGTHPGGHALVGARVYVPVDQLDDPDRRAALGVGADVPFRTKPQLAIDILTDMVADHTMPPWAAGDEVYGRAGELRTFLQDNEIGYVLRVGCAFHVEVAPGVKARADELVDRFVGPDAWQICSVVSAARSTTDRLGML